MGLLSWRSFGSNFLKTFDFLHKAQKFADVTLVSEDRIEFQAHRAVLAACSPVLRNLLHDGSSHIHLTGVTQQELQALLEFIYLGKTIIDATRYEEFFNLANDLNIQGLQNQLDLALENVGNSTKGIKPRMRYINMSQTEDVTNVIDCNESTQITNIKREEKLYEPNENNQNCTKRIFSYIFTLIWFN